VIKNHIFHESTYIIEMAKTERYRGYHIDLERLATRIEAYLQENGFEVAFSKEPSEKLSLFFIQARKYGALRTVAGARRSTDIVIKGYPNNFVLNIGTGEWGRNLLMSIPLLIVPTIAIAATVAKLYVGKRFESNLRNYIRDQIGFLKDSTMGKALAAQQDTRLYDCDYVEGYPKWKSQAPDGKLLLERQRDGKNRIVFKVDSGEIIMPAEQISNAKIIRRNGLHADELMIQITYKDLQGRVCKPIFNMNDHIISGVLAGINELTGEDKVLRSLEHTSLITEIKFCISCSVEIPKAAKFCSYCGERQSIK